jgi:hypothetical protein
MTLGEALEVLKARGEELADPDTARPVAVPQGGGRAVPAFYPEFADAEQFRRWDGSEQAEAWALLMDARDAAILASVGALAGAGVEGTDHAGVIALLWNLDADEAAEFVRRHRGGDERGRPTGLRSFRRHALRGKPYGEGARDGTHVDNRGGRGGTAPTAALLRRIF